MYTTPKMSKKLLYSTIFGVVIIGGALYISTTNTTTIPIQEYAIEDSVDTTQTIDTLWKDSNNSTSANMRNEVMDTPLTETDILTRSLIRPYVEQVRSDTFTEESGQDIINRLTEEVFTLDYTPINISAILITDDISKSSTLQYKTALYQAMQPLFGLGEYELTIYARAVKHNSKEDFNLLYSLSGIYRGVGDAILTIPAPQDISSVHLAIINSLYKFSVVLEDLSKGFSDPAASLSGTGNFVKAEEYMTQSFSRLKTYFILKDVANVTM